jgi:hypothetical protein
VGVGIYARWDYEVIKRLAAQHGIPMPREVPS